MLHLNVFLKFFESALDAQHSLKVFDDFVFHPAIEEQNTNCHNKQVVFSRVLNTDETT